MQMMDKNNAPGWYLYMTRNVHVYL